MEHKFIFRSILPLILLLTLAPAASASSTWYVDGVNGNDNNDCLSSQTACQTIGHAISLCSSGDSIMVAPATYVENLTIDRSLKIIGSDAKTTIIDGNQAGSVVTISSATANVRLAKLTIRNGLTSGNGGGLNNSGTLTINKCIVSGNAGPNDGGGIYNAATLTSNNSTISGNTASNHGGGISNHDGATLTINEITISGNSAATGGGIHNRGTMTINKSTIIGNSNWNNEGGGIFNDGYYASATLMIKNTTFSGNSSSYAGGGILNYGGTVAINNSTFSGNTAVAFGGGIYNWSMLTVSNSTISGNSAAGSYGGGGIGNHTGGRAVLQNTVVANSLSGRNCSTRYSDPITSNGYNLSSDTTCNFTGPGDMKNTHPKLGQLKDNGGPTQTIRLLRGSPAIDAGNPNGCTDDQGNLLKTDQRGWQRPGKQSGRCDIGAFERQIN